MAAWEDHVKQMKELEDYQRGKIVSTALNPISVPTLTGSGVLGPSH